MPFRKTYRKYGIFSTKDCGASLVKSVAAVVLMCVSEEVAVCLK